MKFETSFGAVNLTKEEVYMAERITGLPRKLAVHEITITMAEEFVWPDEATVKTYVRAIYAKLARNHDGNN